MPYRMTHARKLPISTFSEKDIDPLRELIAQDARYPIEKLALYSGINSSATFTILIQKLTLPKVCARWVPHLLTDEQKQNRISCAKTNV